MIATICELELLEASIWDYINPNTLSAHDITDDSRRSYVVGFSCVNCQFYICPVQAQSWVELS